MADPKWWIVETRATVARTYWVEAESEKEAIAKSTYLSPDHEEDVDEETLSVRKTGAVRAAALSRARNEKETG